MVAITTTSQPLSRPWPARRPGRARPRHLELVRPAPRARPSVAPATYRRRRLAVAAVAGALVVACALVVVLLQPGDADGRTVVRTDGGAAATAAGSHPVVLRDLAGYGAGRTPIPDGARYVVRPGDTLWSIAAVIAPGRDVRDVVDELAALNGGPVLQAGQVIRLR